MTDSAVDTSRTTVRTYVPDYQRAEWDDHADELGMSRSEYVRTMVQAGRRGFGRDDESTGSADDETDEETRSPDADPRGQGLETRVVEALSAEAYLSWDELVEALTDDIEARLEETLQELQSADRVRYSGRNGGYALDE